MNFRHLSSCGTVVCFDDIVRNCATKRYVAYCSLLDRAIDFLKRLSRSKSPKSKAFHILVETGCFCLFAFTFPLIRNCDCK